MRAVLMRRFLTSSSRASSLLALSTILLLSYDQRLILKPQGPAKARIFATKRGSNPYYALRRQRVPFNVFLPPRGEPLVARTGDTFQYIHTHPAHLATRQAQQETNSSSTLYPRGPIFRFTTTGSRRSPRPLRLCGHRLPNPLSQRVPRQAARPSAWQHP